jgi:hypothetical protein
MGNRVPYFRPPVGSPADGGQYLSTCDHHLVCPTDVFLGLVHRGTSHWHKSLKWFIEQWFGNAIAVRLSPNYFLVERVVL